MAVVNIKTGRKRNKYVEFVVVGDEAKGCKLGDIRWVWWDRHKSSPMLKIDYRDPKERTQVKEIRLDGDYQQRGWRLLRDMYAEDPDRAKYWDDFVAFAEAQHTNPLGMEGKKFPDDRLPTALLEMRKRGSVAKAERTEFVFPSDGVKVDSANDDGAAEADAKGSKKSASARR